MIKGFENLTRELSDQEIFKIKPRIVDMLKRARGKTGAIKNKEIIYRLKQEGINIGPSMVRVIIHHIRVYGDVKLVIATSDGYYVAENDVEIEGYLESLSSRIKAIRAVQSAIVRQQAESQQTGNLFAEASRG